MKIRKLDAAHSQLITAIDMYFNDGDAVSIHTLACASREIYEKHCKKQKIPRMFDYIQETHKESETGLWNILNKARNFFKHEGNSLDEVIELNEGENKHMLFIACHDCAMLCTNNQPIESQLFNIWYLATVPISKAEGEEGREEMRNLDNKFPNLRASSSDEQRKVGLEWLINVRKTGNID